MGSMEMNNHADKKLKAGRGTNGKTAVLGASNRATGRVPAPTSAKADRASLHDFVAESAAEGATAHTDRTSGHVGISYEGCRRPVLRRHDCGWRAVRHRRLMNPHTLRKGE